MDEFLEIDYKIKSEIVNALWLLGAKSDLISTIGSWKEHNNDGELILCSLRCWNEWKRNDLKERLNLGT